MIDELPDGWSTATVEELTGVGGLMTDGDWIESKDQSPDGDVRLIQLADIGDGEFVDKSARYLTSQTAERLNCTFLHDGDLLIARMPDPLGRACIFPGAGQPSVTAVDVCIWRSGGDGSEAGWLMHTINSPQVRAEILALAGGTTRQRISGGNLKRLCLPVPPIPEQRRIVAKIDSLFARSSRARDELAHIPKQIERYRQAVLEAAFKDSPASGWAESSVEDIVSDSRVGLVRSKTEQRTAGGTPYVRMQHYDLWGRWRFEDLTYVELTSDELSLYRLEPGDLLFNTRNSAELVGKMAIWPDNRHGFVYNNNILRLRFRSHIDPRFVMFALRGSGAAQQLEAAKSATTSVAAIYQRDLMGCRIPLPRDRGVQSKLADIIEAQLAAIDAMEREMLRASGMIDRLDQSILDKAFTGKLVPQDPNDEPASKLLERIQAARAAAPKVKRGRRKVTT